ncbi:MAG: PPOX class F420-dependent oxidoreductase [Chloroflexota bacterium]|nr:PPOX class F420-dependent oxidoreductase [Chloroflexota bacterium]
MASTTQTVIPADKLDLLESTALAHVATLGPNGEPQNNPVWFDWDGEYLLFSQTTTRQKYRNLQNDPRVALSIVDPDNPYRYLEVRGTVVDFRPDPDFAFINKMSAKYTGNDVYQGAMPGEERVVIVVRPEHTTSMG